jgi:hypothetical protein
MDAQRLKRARKIEQLQSRHSTGTGCETQRVQPIPSHHEYASRLPDSMKLQLRAAFFEAESLRP